MGIESIKQELKDNGKNPDDYIIVLCSENHQIWTKEVAPSYLQAIFGVSQELESKVMERDVKIVTLEETIDVLFGGV